MALYAVTSLALSVATAYLILPRPVRYFLGIGVLTLLLPRLAAPSARALTCLYGVALANAILLEVAIAPLVDSSLGYPGSGRQSPHPLSVLGSLGEVSIGVLVVAYFAPELRSAVGQFLRPRPPAIDALRAGVVAVALLLACVAVGRMFTGWVGIGLVPTYASANKAFNQSGSKSNTSGTIGKSASTQENAGSESFDSGYPLPSDVDRSLTQRFESAGSTVESHHCEYFAPGLGGSPVYNCAFKIDGIWHDDIEGTGHPDGTFSWEDDS